MKICCPAWHTEENDFDALLLNDAMLTLGKVSRPEAESDGFKKKQESVQRAQTLLALNWTRGRHY